MKELVGRLTSATPLFFRKLQVFGASIGVMGTAVTQIPKVPISLSSVAGHVIWVGAVIVAVAQCACTNTPEKK